MKEERVRDLRLLHESYLDSDIILHAPVECIISNGIIRIIFSMDYIHFDREIAIYVYKGDYVIHKFGTFKLTSNQDIIITSINTNICASTSDIVFNLNDKNELYLLRQICMNVLSRLNDISHTYCIEQTKVKYHIGDYVLAVSPIARICKFE